MAVITMPNKFIFLTASVFFSSPLLMTLATLSAFFFYLVGVRILVTGRTENFAPFHWVPCRILMVLVNG